MNKNTQRRITQLQGRMAVASFTAGVVIALACLFIVPPPGEISTSALSLVSEFLVLAGAMLGVKVSVDAKLQRFRSQVLDAERRAREGATEEPEEEESDEV